MDEKIILEYDDISYKNKLKKKDMKLWIEMVLNALDKKGYSVSVTFTDDETIRQINKTYRNKDSSTDVLSFSQMEGEGFDFNNTFLGDIVVAVPYAGNQADKLGHDLVTEVKYLLLHGILHLLGYDHDEDESGEMSRLEKEIYTKLTGELIV